MCTADKDRVKISLYGGLKLCGEILVIICHLGEVFYMCTHFRLNVSIKGLTLELILSFVVSFIILL